MPVRDGETVFCVGRVRGAAESTAAVVSEDDPGLQRSERD